MPKTSAERAPAWVRLLMVSAVLALAGCAPSQPPPPPEVLDARPIVPNECNEPDPPQAPLQGGASNDVLADMQASDDVLNRTRALRAACRAGLAAQSATSN